MSLLYEIQKSLVQDDVNLCSILLKLRLLAARLGSRPLEDWIKHESDGYPSDIDVPAYRVISVTYSGTFSGPFGSGIENAPIPTYLIEKYAGKEWTKYEIREGIAAIDELMATSSGGGGTLGVDASNLILLLQGKVYGDYACNDIRGTISRSALAELQYAVRSRVLELTIELEKTVPEAAQIDFGSPDSAEKLNSEKVTQIYQQIIYGNVTTITGGDNSHFFLAINERDDKALIKYLVKSGIAESDAAELAKLFASEEPAGKEEPFGPKAKAWLIANLKKATDGTWKVGISIATKLFTEAALKYYGLK